MEVSVVVPAFNEERMLDQTLRSLKYQTVPCEIVVCDNNSTDNTFEIAKKYADKALREKRQGATHALNKGMKSSSGDLVAITGADCVVPPNWVENFIKVFKDPNVIACYGPVNPLENRHKTYFSILNYAEMICIKTGLWFVVQGANCMFRRDILEKVGYFDPNVELFEENGFFKRIRKMGKIKFLKRNFIKASTRRVDECGKHHLVRLGVRQMIKLTFKKRTDATRFKAVRY